MALVTETMARQRTNNGAFPFQLGVDEVLSPSARSWLDGTRTQTKVVDKVYETLSGARLLDKPEHMTHLHGNVLVNKDHSRIGFRGEIDRLESEILWCQLTCSVYGTLVAELEEVLGFVRKFIRYDVLEEPMGQWTLCGYTPDQLREYSHYPEKQFGQGHFLPSWEDGVVVLALNRVRTVVRQVELSAYRSFSDREGKPTRGDMILGLNRLSSLFWIMMIKGKVGQYETK